MGPLIVENQTNLMLCLQNIQLYVEIASHLLSKGKYFPPNDYALLAFGYTV